MRPMPSLFSAHGGVNLTIGCKMKYHLCLLFLFCVLATHAQTITITGKIIDKESKEGLPFASIGINGISLGTISNLSGEFDFHIPVRHRNDLLVISMLGYQQFEAPVFSLQKEQLVIEMEKSNFLLKEVVVADTLQGGEIMAIALSKINQNYPSQPFMLEGFYRDLKKVANTYISLLEAALKVYDEDYEEPRNKLKLRERVSLIEVRRSLGYSSKFTSFFDNDNLLQDLLLENMVRYRMFPEDESFFKSLMREKDSEYAGMDVFVVSHKEHYFLRVYIDKKTFGIVHIDYEDREQKVLGKKKGLVSKFEGLKRTIDFKWVDGKLYVNYILLNSRVSWYDEETQKLKFETELIRQFSVNKVTPNTAERINMRDRMKGYSLQYQDRAYNKAFWDNYNMIKESALDKSIIKDLEREGSLESQFQDN
jgi:hypothetical protein